MPSENIAKKGHCFQDYFCFCSEEFESFISLGGIFHLKQACLLSSLCYVQHAELSSSDQRETHCTLFTKANLMGNQGTYFTKLTSSFELISSLIHRPCSNVEKASLNLENVLSLIGALSLNCMPWILLCCKCTTEVSSGHMSVQNLQKTKNKTTKNIPTLQN